MLHIHENVTSDKGRSQEAWETFGRFIEKKLQVFDLTVSLHELIFTMKELSCELPNRIDAKVTHIECVKSYAPRVHHLVGLLPGSICFSL